MAIHADISTRASHAEIERAILSMYEMASGYRSPNEAAKALLVRIGLATLGEVKQAFLVKARGGTDVTGLTWPKLSKKTVAYSRRHKDGTQYVPKGFYRALYAPSWMLTEKQRKRWWALYRQYGGGGQEGPAYHQGGGNPYAARLAWRILKAEGARTLLGVYGDVPVEILRSSGLLYNSLSPGQPIQGAGPMPAHVADQVFRIERAAVLVGTKRRHALTHHEGLGHVPQRRLWPEPATWPTVWWNNILESAQQGCVDILIEILRHT